jgi:hypothetical protein
VGVVDVFFDPKPYVDSAEFKRIQSPQIPLLRIKKMTWTNAETLEAGVEFVNFGKEILNRSVIEWSLNNKSGEKYAGGTFGPLTIPVGPVTGIGKLNIPLDRVEEAVAFDLVVSLNGTPIYNRWNIWVYPETPPKVTPSNTLITTKWDKKAKQYLDKGGNVFLMADTAMVNSDVPPGFSGISWNAVWSGTPPNLLGILCDPLHESLKNFPTEYHSNWQWFDLVRNSRPMLLDHTPYTFKPLVQIIPDWNNNRKIGLIFEAKVSNGKLIMTSIDFPDIMKNSPVARQMYYSLLMYIDNGRFNPEETLSIEMIDKIFK